MNYFGVKPFIVAMRTGERPSHALSCVASLSRAMGASVELLSVVPDPLVVETRRQQLETLVSLSDLPDLPKYDIPVSKDASDVIAAASQRGIVCMETSTRHLPHDGHIGSYAERTVKYARFPVVLVGPNATGSLDGIAKVVVPVDGSTFSERAVASGAALAEALSTQMWVVTVVTPEQRVAAVSAGVTVDSGYVRHADERFGGQFEVLNDTDVAHAIAGFAGGDGLTVMTSHGRTGLERLAMGSVAQAVVATAKKPVVVIPREHP